MILFNFKKVLQHSNKSCNRFIKIIRYITYRPIPYSKQDDNLIFSRINWRGNSFLLNPKKLLRERKRYTDLEIYEYIALASRRNYAEYRVLGKTTLDLDLCIDKESIILKNRLLQIKNGQVHFKFEEALN